VPSFDASRQRYGSPRIHADLLEQDEHVSRKRVIRLMQEGGLEARAHKVNDRHVTIKALEMALKRRGPEIGLLHHSDQGCTYASEDYQAILDAQGIVCSMSRRDNWYDNAVMESFFSTVKSELADRFDTYGKMELLDYIEVFYNQQRRHSTLGQISPAAFERRATHAA
jgi:transposase InsO family protein